MKPNQTEGSTGVEFIDKYTNKDEPGYYSTPGKIIRHLLNENAACLAALKELTEIFYKIESIITEDSDILWLNEMEWKQIKSAIERAKKLL